MLGWSKAISMTNKCCHGMGRLQILNSRCTADGHVLARLHLLPIPSCSPVDGLRKNPGATTSPTLHVCSQHRRSVVRDLPKILDPEKPELRSRTVQSPRARLCRSRTRPSCLAHHDSTPGTPRSYKRSRIGCSSSRSVFLRRDPVCARTSTARASEPTLVSPRFARLFISRPKGG